MVKRRLFPLVVLISTLIQIILSAIRVLIRRLAQSVSRLLNAQAVGICGFKGRTSLIQCNLLSLDSYAKTRKQFTMDLKMLRKKLLTKHQFSKLTKKKMKKQFKMCKLRKKKQVQQ